MADDDQKPEAVPDPTPISNKRREKTVTKLSERMGRLERIIDTMLLDHEPAYMSYVSLHRARHGCDPDTSEVPVDFLETFHEEPEE